jgi:hypothetical protein
MVQVHLEAVAGVVQVELVVVHQAQHQVQRVRAVLEYLVQFLALRLAMRVGVEAH